MAHGPDTERLLKTISEMRGGKLDLDNLNIVSLPELPYGLRKLSCCYTGLTTLPTLPDTLEDLQCCNTPLTSLPELPPNLLYLDIDTTQLITLPKLPRSLRALFIYNTPLVSLPVLPQFLETFICSSTAITEIPDIPRFLCNLVVINCPNLRIEPELGETIKDYSERWSKIRTQRRNEVFKEDLIAEFWKPSRVAKMLERGGWDLVDSY
jgi:Leucine-rich repeat (LRR) protein